MYHFIDSESEKFRFLIRVYNTKILDNIFLVDLLCAKRFNPTALIESSNFKRKVIIKIWIQVGDLKSDFGTRCLTRNFAKAKNNLLLIIIIFISI
jgi:hypothetical protein